MPRFIRVIISLSDSMWVEWSSVSASLGRVSRAFLATGLVVEQMERAMRTSLRSR